MCCIANSGQALTVGLIDFIEQRGMMLTTKSRAPARRRTRGNTKAIITQAITTHSPDSEDPRTFRMQLRCTAAHRLRN
jgi:hypothetical protein